MYLIECKDEKVEVSTSKIMEGESIRYDTVVWYYFGPKIIIRLWRKSFCELQMNYVKVSVILAEIINFNLLLIEVGGQQWTLGLKAHWKLF